MPDKKTDLMLVFDAEQGTLFKNGDTFTSANQLDLNTKKINKVVVEEALNGGFAIRVSYTVGTKTDLIVVETNEEMHAAVGLLFRVKLAD